MSGIFTIVGLVCYALAIFKPMEAFWSLGYLILGSIFLVGGAIIRRLK